MEQPEKIHESLAKHTGLNFWHIVIFATMIGGFFVQNGVFKEHVTNFENQTKEQISEIKSELKENRSLGERLARIEQRLIHIEDLLEK